MSQTRTVAQTFETGRPATAGKLLKADHPRAIDWYIDYFGGPPAAGLASFRWNRGGSQRDNMDSRHERPEIGTKAAS